MILVALILRVSLSVAQSDSLVITGFNTHAGAINPTDSTWNLAQKIHLPSLPTSVSITVKDPDEASGLNLVCIIQEDLKLYNTVKMGANPTVHFYNLTGGNYTVTFKNLTNHHQARLNFEIETVFWEKWWFGPLMIFLISVILGVVFYFIYIIKLRERLKNQEALHELEMKALRAQMNPHFVFNSMNTIDAYVLNKRFIEASDYLQKFSKLIRHTLENSEHATVPVSRDLQSLQLYLELEQERFQHTFRFRISPDKELLEADWQIPPLLIQPFVENAIIHGVRHLPAHDGDISITLHRIAKAPDADQLMIKIRDNGVGRRVSAEINGPSHHKSMGIAITLNRIANFQALHGEKTETLIHDLAEGTEVQIILPLVKS